MSKGPPTEPRAPKLGSLEAAVASLGHLGEPFGHVWAPLGFLFSDLVAPLPPRGLRGPALVDDLLADNDPKVPVTAEM